MNTAEKIMLAIFDASYIEDNEQAAAIARKSGYPMLRVSKQVYAVPPARSGLPYNSMPLFILD